MAENLNRKFNPEALNQAGPQTSPIFRTHSGWLYLAVVMDLCSRRGDWLGDGVTHASRAGLPGVDHGAGQRNPAEGVLLHSDRGSQYASEEYQALLKKHKMVCSMSRKGNCCTILCFFSAPGIPHWRDCLCLCNGTPSAQFLCPLRHDRRLANNYCFAIASICRRG